MKKIILSTTIFLLCSLLTLFSTEVKPSSIPSPNTNEAGAITIIIDSIPEFKTYIYAEAENFNFHIKNPILAQYINDENEILELGHPNKETETLKINTTESTKEVRFAVFGQNDEYLNFPLERGKTYRIVYRGHIPVVIDQDLKELNAFYEALYNRIYTNGVSSWMRFNRPQFFFRTDRITPLNEVKNMQPKMDQLAVDETAKMYAYVDSLRTTSITPLQMQVIEAYAYAQQDHIKHVREGKVKLPKRKPAYTPYASSFLNIQNDPRAGSASITDISGAHFTIRSLSTVLESQELTDQQKQYILSTLLMEYYKNGDESHRKEATKHYQKLYPKSKIIEIYTAQYPPK